MMRMEHPRRLVLGVTALALAGGGLAVTALPASAAPTTGQASSSSVTSQGVDGNYLTRRLEVWYADKHWADTAWNDTTPVPFGSAQPDEQCAEFVARAMATAGLIPGLSPDAPQSSYFDYQAPNGKTYDLLLITPVTGYNTIYDYLMDSGLATDVGDDPSAAQPGDFVVTYLGYDGEASHMGLIATAPTATSEPTVDAHNNARYRYGYHYYEPAHLVKLVPNAFTEVWTWAAEQWALHGAKQLTPSVPAPSTTTPSTTNRTNTLIRLADPSGPQV